MSNSYPSAGIQITITKFVPVSQFVHAMTYSFADVLLVGTGTGKVSQDGGVNTQIRVDKSAQVDLVFAVDPGITGKHYNPVGVSFFADDRDLGLDDFPVRTVAADAFRRLLLTAHDANVNGKSYKFNLVVQEAETGLLGVIDPQIKNGLE